MLTTIWKDLDRRTVPATMQLQPLLSEIDSMFNELQTPTWSNSPALMSPTYDVQETADAYGLTFDIPGVDKGDLNIEVEGTKLVVSGERKGMGERQGGTRNNRYGKFQLVFTLPEGVQTDQIEAHHKNGVLTMSVPKPAAAKRTKIQIGDGVEKSSFLKSQVSDKASSQGFRESIGINTPKVAVTN